MSKFVKGDLVRVTEIDLLDEAMGIKVGDIFEVTEEDNTPYCKPITENIDIEETMNDSLWALNEEQLELVVSVEFMGEEWKFKKGDLVEILVTDEDDISMGIEVGDVFEVLEDSRVPYCKPTESLYDGFKYAFSQDQLRLVKEEE